MRVFPRIMFVTRKARRRLRRPPPLTATFCGRSWQAPRIASVVSLVLVVVGTAGCGTGAATTRLTVVARGLANPRQLSFGPDGVLYVADAGSGGHERCAVAPDTKARVCVGESGAILAISHGRLRRVITGLPSAANAGGAESSGVADVVETDGRLAFVVQDTSIDRAGANQFGTVGTDLGHLLTAPVGGGKLHLGANFARFEATHNPDHGAGASAADAIESDPYALAAYRGGFIVADAAGNDLLRVTPDGQVRVLAVFPIQHETTTATAGQKSTRIAVQSVPTSIAVSPSGAIYVSELTGYPFKPGFARIWRVVPGHRATVYARGFTSISSIALDHEGRLLVLEIDRDGLLNTKASGELIRLNGLNRRTVLATTGLVAPTGVAVAPDGAIYISNYGTSPHAGEIVRLP
jgi:DNA-binding beta-propeller fold protein YncE